MSVPGNEQLRLLVSKDGCAVNKHTNRMDVYNLWKR